MSERLTQSELEAYLWGAAVILRGLVAGAISRRDSRNQSEAYEMISGKIVELIGYP